MISKSEIKYYTALTKKKYRHIEKKFIAEGKRLIEEGIKSKYICEIILTTHQFAANEFDLINKIKKKQIPIKTVPENILTKFTTTQNPQGIVAIFKMPEVNGSFDKGKPLVALENISDPGNLGTILRTCDWFGISNILISKGSADIYNPKVLRAGMGATFFLNISYNIDLIKELKSLKEKNYSLYFADMHGTDYKKLKLRKNYVITFCNEANGPTNELKKICNAGLTIKKKGNVESLNVAAAAAIIISEFHGN